MSRVRVLLADDHPVVREGLKLLINAQPDMEVVGEAGDGEEALRQALETQPDVLVTDLTMPRINGAQLTRQIRREFPAIKVLALTVHEDESYLRQMMEMGAAGYVVKRAAANDLTAAIRVVAAGGVYLDSNFAGKVIGGYLGAAAPAEPANTLSERESEVLRLIAWGYSIKEIAEQLHLSIKTVETYKARLTDKLGLYTRTDLVRYALRQGWLREN